MSSTGMALSPASDSSWTNVQQSHTADLCRRFNSLELIPPGPVAFLALSSLSWFLTWSVKEPPHDTFNIPDKMFLLNYFFFHGHGYSFQHMLHLHASIFLWLTLRKTACKKSGAVYLDSTADTSEHRHLVYILRPWLAPDDVSVNVCVGQWAGRARMGGWQNTTQILWDELSLLVCNMSGVRPLLYSQ